MRREEDQDYDTDNEWEEVDNRRNRYSGRSSNTFHQHQNIPPNGNVSFVNFLYYSGHLSSNPLPNSRRVSQTPNMSSRNPSKFKTQSSSQDSNVRAPCGNGRREAWQRQESSNFTLGTRTCSVRSSNLFRFNSELGKDSKFKRRFRPSFDVYCQWLNKEFQERLFDYFDLTETYCTWGIFDNI